MKYSKKTTSRKLQKLGNMLENIINGIVEFLIISILIVIASTPILSILLIQNEILEILCLSASFLLVVMVTVYTFFIYLEYDIDIGIYKLWRNKELFVEIDKLVSSYHSYISKFEPLQIKQYEIDTKSNWLKKIKKNDRYKKDHRNDVQKMKEAAHQYAINQMINRISQKLNQDLENIFIELLTLRYPNLNEKFSGTEAQLIILIVSILSLSGYLFSNSRWETIQKYLQKKHFIHNRKSTLYSITNYTSNSRLEYESNNNNYHCDCRTYFCGQIQCSKCRGTYYFFINC